MTFSIPAVEHVQYMLSYDLQSSSVTTTAILQPVSVFQKSPGIIGIRVHAKPAAKESAITGILY